MGDRYILLVDSDLDALSKSVDALRRQDPDAKLISTTDAMDAVRYSLNHPVDAVYTEVLMPRCSGFDVVRLVRKFHPDADAYFLSSSEQFAARVRKQGLGRYLPKRVLWAETGPKDLHELTEDELNWVAAAGENDLAESKKIFK